MKTQQFLTNIPVQSGRGDIVSIHLGKTIHILFKDGMCCEFTYKLINTTQRKKAKVKS